MRKYKSLPVELTDDEMDQSEDALNLSIKEIRHRIGRRIQTAERRTPNTTYSLRANEVVRLFNIIGWKCVYCGTSLHMEWENTKEDAPPDLLVVEHMTPLRGGGLNVITNIVCACHACNTKKANLSLSAFLKQIGLDEVNFRTQLKNWLAQHNSMQEY